MRGLLPVGVLLCFCLELAKAVCGMRMRFCVGKARRSAKRTLAIKLQ